MWGIVDGGTLMNPINMSEWSNTLDQQTYQLNCPNVGNEIMTVNINIYGESCMPVVILLLFTVCPSGMLLKICFRISNHINYAPQSLQYIKIKGGKYLKYYCAFLYNIFIFF